MSSTVIAKNIQVGTSGTATNNFNWYQPASPDGTVRLGVGNYGATTLDAVTVSNSGNVTVSGSVTGGALSGSSLAVSGAATTGSLTVNSNAISAVNSLGFRNRILNGDCRIDQRNVGASISFPGGDGNYCLDRWRLQRQGAGTMTVQQVSSAPTGFTNALKFTVTGTSTPSATDFYTFGQIIEGFNCSDLMWGTASAQSVTLSFWINSSVTGTYSASVYTMGGTSDAYPATFAVSAANTWEFKTITIPGATTGTWPTNNSGSIYFRIDLGSGSNYSTATANAWNTSGLFRTNSSVNFISNASATLTVTGVQLEAGTVASPFERRDYGRELMMCQRYYEKSYNVDVVPGTNTGVGILYFITGSATGNVGGKVPFAVSKRATPTITIYPADGASAGNITTDFLGEVTANVLSQGQSGFSVYVAGGGSAAGAVYGHYVASIEL